MEMPAVLRQSRAPPTGSLRAPGELAAFDGATATRGAGHRALEGMPPAGISEQTCGLDGAPPTAQMRKVRIGRLVKSLPCSSGVSLTILPASPGRRILRHEAKRQVGSAEDVQLPQSQQAAGLADCSLMLGTW